MLGGRNLPTQHSAASSAVEMVVGCCSKSQNIDSSLLALTYVPSQTSINSHVPMLVNRKQLVKAQTDRIDRAIHLLRMQHASIISSLNSAALLDSAGKYVFSQSSVDQFSLCNLPSTQTTSNECNQHVSFLPSVAPVPKSGAVLGTADLHQKALKIYQRHGIHKQTDSARNQRANTHTTISTVKTDQIDPGKDGSSAHPLGHTSALNQ
mmetsp:Transcript_42551/g.113914  ORF Transcript_42551/g.113914 Transcript_42551/m.113914 type:complete len:208 (+) Transcript_42551:33-656(+)|eukprot:CAMPEP_0113665506 /NCGR_PEP_ID=MMETSP0038_2-20120614/2343_1 /TAXON_ID=2898 /ORGANISM="Cryptomonas paramecium" /LENGTH=207 /DNA_ID=CAMNT_0000580867 /DNA_START=21 /DNA_END=644 /DNA_ORIENTATION=- /assembly_acc=CAM_ASM_000170